MVVPHLFRSHEDSLLGVDPALLALTQPSASLSQSPWPKAPASAPDRTNAISIRARPVPSPAQANQLAYSSSPLPRNPEVSRSACSSQGIARDCVKFAAQTALDILRRVILGLGQKRPPGRSRKVSFFTEPTPITVHSFRAATGRERLRIQMRIRQTRNSGGNASIRPQACRPLLPPWNTAINSIRPRLTR